MVRRRWHDNYTGAPEDGAAWTAEGSDRVIRGGGWARRARNCRCAYRGIWAGASVTSLPRLPAGSGLQVQGGRRSVLLSQECGVRAARAGTAAQRSEAAVPARASQHEARGVAGGLPPARYAGGKYPPFDVNSRASLAP
jgi:hypothetical protein